MTTTLLQGTRLVDLSVQISDDLPALWPGNPPMRFETFHSYDDTPPYFNRVMHVDEHIGTHWDAPSHFLERGDGLFRTEDVPLERLIVPAAVIDASDLVGTGSPGVSPRVGVDRIGAWEAEHGRIAAGEGVLLRCGWADRYFKPFPEGNRFAQDVIDGAVPAWPSFDAAAVELLASRGVTLLGFDVPSAGAWDDVANVHRIALERNLILVENLIGLGQLPERGALFMFLPLKITGGSGAPGRAVGIIPA
jgi:kynurenine formamidase